MPKTPSPSSQALYEACLSPDPAVKQEAYQTLWHYLKRVSLSALWQSTIDRETKAEDFAQMAIERVFIRIYECREPKAFRSWARQIVKNIIIDELRRTKPTDSLEVLDDSKNKVPTYPSFELESIRQITEISLRDLLNRSPMSERSKRVVVGRFLDNQDDSDLAQVETVLSGQLVRPSNIQVTRAKNLVKLRNWDGLASFWEM